MKKIKGKIKPGLSTQSRKQGIGFFLFNNLGHAFHGQRFDISRVGKFGIGHDGGRIAIDQRYSVTFFTQSFAGLSPAVVKLASLSNYYGPRSDDQDVFNIVSSRHGLSKKSKKRLLGEPA